MKKKFFGSNKNFDKGMKFCEDCGQRMWKSCSCWDNEPDCVPPKRGLIFGRLAKKPLSFYQDFTY